MPENTLSHALSAARRLGACATLVFACSVAVAAAPPAPSEPVVDTIQGVRVADPYRNLENLKSPATLAWLKAKGDEAAAQLARIEGRDAMAKRIAELAAASGDSISGVVRMPGERVFFLRRKSGETQFKLVMRSGAGAAERVLVDPEALARRDGVPRAINYFRPSWDGKLVAYGISAGGSENASLEVIESDTGRRVGATIPRVREHYLHWTPDNRYLSFNQVRELAPATPDTETFLDTTAWLYEPGRPDAAPTPLFGPLVDKTLGLARLDVAQVIFAADSRWMVARTTDTTVPEGRLFVAPLAALGSAKIAWRSIATAADKITAVELRGDTLYLQSLAGAPRGRLLALALTANAVLGDAKVVVAEPEAGVLTRFGLGRDAIYTQVQQGFASRVRRHPRDGGPGRDAAPGRAGSTFLTEDAAHAYGDVWLATRSWTEPPRIFAATADGSVSDTQLLSGARPPGAPEIEVSEVMVPSHDGALVPMAVLRKKGLALDGSNPALLIGYGAYGFSYTNFFDPRSIAWLERGGVLAYANVRGSGALGDAWHRAGFKATKANTWKDGIACARWLIRERYTSAKTLGIMGGSAGGIFVGRAVTSEPGLFAAAIFDVGMMDAVRSEESANGITNISEFGSWRNPDEFGPLLEMSTYHQIRDGTAYPAVLLIHGMNDPRVDVWQSAKAAARLQAATSSGKPILLRLDEQAGHGVGSTALQGYSKLADIYSFLLWQFGKTGPEH
jgi:prolyl oligopeptidase